MYAIDYESLEQAAGKDRARARAKVQQLAAECCLDEIEAINPDYYHQLADALQEPVEDLYARQELPLLEGDADDDEFEPCAYAYENGMCPEYDGHYSLPDILSNAIYYKPTVAEVARGEHNRRYGITASDNGIYDTLFDNGNYNHRPRGGKSGKTRRSAPKTTRAQRVEAILARRNKS